MNREDLKAALLYHALQCACTLIAELKEVDRVTHTAPIMMEFLIATMSATSAKINDPKVQEALRHYANTAETFFGTSIDMIFTQHGEIEMIEPSPSYQEASIGVLWAMLKLAANDDKTVLKGFFSQVKGMSQEQIAACSVEAAVSLVSFAYEDRAE